MPARGWRTFAIEINLRKGGTTHPYLTLALLTGGSYDPMSARFRTPAGAARHLVATDQLKIEGCSTAWRAAQIVDRHGLRFDAARGDGVVLHMLAAASGAGRMGLTAIAPTAEPPRGCTSARRPCCSRRRSPRGWGAGALAVRGAAPAAGAAVGRPTAEGPASERALRRHLPGSASQGEAPMQEGHYPQNTHSSRARRISARGRAPARQRPVASMRANARRTARRRASAEPS